MDGGTVLAGNANPHEVVPGEGGWCGARVRGLVSGNRLPGGTFLAAVGHRIYTLHLGHELHSLKLEALGISATEEECSVDGKYE